MTNVSEEGDEHARLLEAIPRHMRADGTVNLTSLAREFGLHRSNMKRRVVALSASGALGTNPVLPGFMIRQTTAQFRNGELVAESVKQVPEGDVTEAVPKGFAIKGVSTLRDAHGRTIVEWTKTREEPGAVDIAETLKAAFADYEPAAKPVRAQYEHYIDDLALYALPDLHVGSYSWGRENGGDDWDLKIAEEKISLAMHSLAGMTPHTKTAIVLGGGDAMHSDNNQNMTARSGNALQVDGRYQKVLGVACRLFVKQVDLALWNHESVIVRVLRGNHDEHSATAIAYFLSAWYRNEPRVRVDLDPSLFWWFRFGKTFLGATHGHEAKSKGMAAIMASRRAEDWGKSAHRYCHTFHRHHAEKLLSEGEGVITETHQAPVAQDAWHFGQGFLSGRSLQSIVYDREHGEVGRSRVAITSN